MRTSDRLREIARFTARRGYPHEAGFLERIAYKLDRQAKPCVWTPENYGHDWAKDCCDNLKEGKYIPKYCSDCGRKVKINKEKVT